MAQSRSGNSGSNVPTTQLWDTTDIYRANINNKDLTELLVRLYQNLNRLAISCNNKESGFYDIEETSTGQQFFPLPGLNSTGTRYPDFRIPDRKVINFGALPDTGTKSVAHGIHCDANTIVTRTYGSTTDPTGGFSYLTLPYPSPIAANNIELSSTGTNVSITTGSNRSAYTICYIVIEYLSF